MKAIKILLIMLVAVPSVAEVYKCKDHRDQWVYRSKPCDNLEINKQNTVKIHHFDQQKIDDAKITLKRQIKEFDKVEKEEARAELEADLAQSRRDLADARYQSEIASQNRANASANYWRKAAGRYDNRGNRVYYDRLGLKHTIIK